MSGEQRIPLADHVADAVALLGSVRRTEVIPLDGRALGRIAVAEQRARVDVPGHDNSQMDGFALAAADLAAAGESVTLHLGPMIAAGDAPGVLEPGTARPIMTGAPIPDGAELVIPVEESAEGRFPRRTPRSPRSRSSPPPSPLGASCAPAARTPVAATPCCARTVCSPRPGSRTWPPAGSATSGCSHRCERSCCPPAPRSAPPGTALPIPVPCSMPTVRGSPPPSPRPAAEVVHTGAVPDDAAVLLEQLRVQIRAHDADLIVTSGGVSMGALEVVRHAAEHDGAVLAFPKVAMQPGGPQGIGTLEDEGRRVPWLAFPGNPVSALLSCELIARPALGAPARRRLRLPIHLEAAEPSPSGLDQYRRARVLPSGRARLVGGASSHLLGGYAAADALVLVPRGTAVVHDGDELETLLIPGGDR